MKGHTWLKSRERVFPRWIRDRWRAKALGMRYGLAMRRIIIPQAIRIIVPPLGNEFNNMLKSTSLAAVIGLLELTGTAQVFGSQSFTEFELLIVATFWYLV